MKQYTFRQSWLNTFYMCPEQARAILAGEVDTDTSTDSQALGTAVHKGIEYSLYEKLDGKKRYHTTAHDVLEHELDGIEWKYTKFGRDKVYTLAHAALTVWHQQVDHLIDPAYIEHDWQAPLCWIPNEHEVTIKGTVDCIDTDGVVWDWKTNFGRPFEQWEKQRWAIQASVYCWGASTITHKEAPWPFYFAILNDTDSEIMPVWRDDTHTAWLAQQCQAIVALIEADLSVWPLNDQGWWCSDRWCPKFSECKGLTINSDWASSKFPSNMEES